ncbi:MAG: Cof-type HAD-IIB family hydrolase [Bacteroidota bacterium]
MKYAVLCSDLDGTLLTTKNDVSEFTISQISRIKDRMQIILVSARMPKSMTYLQKRLHIEHEPIICYNGALIMKGTAEIASTFIALEQIAEIHRLANVFAVKLGLYYKDEWYVEESSERVEKEIRYTKATPVFRDTTLTLNHWDQKSVGAHKIMLMGKKDTTDALLHILQDRFREELHLYRSNDTLIEVAPKSVSKLSAIKSLRPNDHSLEKVIAFGDNYNDMEMLQYVACGVAVGNARPEVKSIADHITLKNTEDGVAHYIKAHL